MVDPALIGYCTNVHAGRDLKTTQEQLAQHAVEVRKQLQQSQLAVGLWLSQSTAETLIQSESQLADFSNWLNQEGLLPYTFNGFPFGDFHQEVVKHDVYLPTWADVSRLQYTRQLATILTQLLKRSDHPLTGTGTISTLPLGWPSTNDPREICQASAQQLLKMVEFLETIHEESRVHIQLCIEPEPGCILGDMDATLKFFQQYLLNGNLESRDRVQRYLAVCYDICHSAVMDEDPETNLKQLAQLGVGIGKVQVSSAVTVDFDHLPSASAKQQAWERLTSFNEPRYLHQTCVYRQDGQRNFYEDLPLALTDSNVKQQGRWVVHFHVPICAQEAGALQTTQSEIPRFIATCHQQGIAPVHWEVETYAWNVLPADMQRTQLAEGIADEIRMLQHWLNPA